MSTEATKAVLDHHQAMLDAGDLDGVMEDYTEDSLFVTNLTGEARGLDAIRAVFAGLGGAMPGFDLTGEVVEGDVAYIWWTADGFAFGTDTFVVRDGRIATQTVGLHLG